MISDSESSTADVDERTYPVVAVVFNFFTSFFLKQGFIEKNTPAKTDCGTAV